MSQDWQSSLDFLEDEHVVRKEFKPTGEMLFINESAGLIDIDQTSSGKLINKEFVLSQPLAPEPLVNVNRGIRLRFSAKYTGYHPIEIKAFHFIEIAESKLYGNSRLQSVDCAQWHKFNTTGEDTSDPGLVVAIYDEDWNLERSVAVGLHNVERGWFPDDNNGPYRPRLLPGEKFYFGIWIIPPSNTDYQILSADSFHLRFDFSFEELTEKRRAQISDEDFEICVPE